MGQAELGRRGKTSCSEAWFEKPRTRDSPTCGAVGFLGGGWWGGYWGGVGYAMSANPSIRPA